MKKVIFSALALFNFLLSALFFLFFYERYWKYRDCIDGALSSCTVGNANLTSGGMVWAFPATFFLVLAIAFVILIFRGKTRKVN